MGQSVYWQTMPLIGRELGFSVKLITSLVSFSALMFLIFTPYWGKLSDQLGRKIIVIVGLIGCAVSLILFSSALSLGTSGILLGWKLLVVLILARMINGVLGSATRPGSGAWIADVTNQEQRSGGFGRLNAGFSAGRIAGPAIAGFLLVISYTLPFYIFSIGLLFISVMLLKQPSADLNKKEEAPVSDLKLLDNRVWPFLIIGISLGICNAALVQTSSFYFLDVIVPTASNPIAYASVGFMLAAFGSIIGQLLIADKLRVSPGSLIRYGTLLMAVALLCISFSKTLNLIYFSFFLFGLGQGTQSTGLAAALSLSVGKHHQGKANGFMGMVIPVGHIFSPLIAMPLYMVSPNYPYLLGFLVMLFSLLFIQLNIFITVQSYQYLTLMVIHL